MAFEGEGSSIVKREWVAVTATTIKASTSASSTLAEHKKIVVAKGTCVTGVIEAEERGHWAIVGGALDDGALPEGLRFLYMNHWELLPESVTRTPAEEQVGPAASSAFHDELVIPVVEATEERVAVPPELGSKSSSRAVRPAIVSITEPASSKPVNHRRLFALFKRNANKE